LLILRESATARVDPAERAYYGKGTDGPGREAVMAGLNGKTLFITGASRGIGKAIALRAAAHGANVVLAAKTAEPHPKLPGTIFTAAREVEAAGGRALPLQVDIRFEEQIAAAAAKAAETFGGIDILVNNASAIRLTGTLQTPMKRFDLLLGVNVRGTFAASQAVLPYLIKGTNPHILNLSPPLSLDPKWFRDHCAYTIAKYGMSLCVLGMAAEFRAAGVAVNALWPKTVIATAAIAMLGDVAHRNCRKPEIVADAACAILARSSRTCTGNFFIDEEVLAAEGVTDFSGYAVEPGAPIFPDLFL
jgi:citronellol/citronellal dehydrogenase